MKVIPAALTLGAGLLCWMWKEAHENNVRYHEISLKGEKERYTLFFISDIHTRKISEKMIRNIHKSVQGVIIGGDLCDLRTPISNIYRNIRLLKTLGPVYFIWGNNDREVGEERLRKVFADTGVTVVENDAVLLPDMRNRCWLSAVDDSSSRKSDPNKAFAKCQEGDSVIFVSHNPALIPKVTKNFHADVYLAGHLHGGQIRFGPFGLHQRGSFSIDENSATLISNGYGTTLVPLRLGAKPECHIIDLNFQQ
jgi:predicted MPP superfamily phosphohydrolase